MSIPASVRVIGKWAFAECGKLRDIDIGKNSVLEVLESRCLQGVMVQGIIVPASVRTLGDGVFRKSGVHSVRFERGSRITHIGAGCFADSAIEEFCLTASVKTMGRDAFEHCEHLAVVYVEDDCQVRIREHVGDKVAVVPSKDAMIGDTELWQYREQKKPKLPEDVDAIKEHWFAQSDVESVTVPASVRELQDYAFFRCERLQKIALAKRGQLERLGQWCFAEGVLEEVVFPQNLRTIGAYAFYRCAGLRRVTFNEGLQCIEQAAFQGTGLESAKLPSTLRALQRRAFCDCASLGSVKLQEGLREIEEEAFRGTGLEEVVLPQSVKAIGVEAFGDCGRLRKLTLAKNSLLEKVGPRAFRGTGLRRDDGLFSERVRVSDSAFDT